jgi:NTE family protein
MGETVNLVLEGGGAKGVALVGAIAELESHGYAFERVAGASVGAIVGALLAAKLSAKELDAELGEFNFGRLAGGRRRVLRRTRAFYSLSARGGIYPMVYLHDWLSGVLAKHGVRTFGDLPWDGDASTRAERRFRLVVTVTDITRGELVYLPWDYHRLYGLDPAAQSVADAVCASAAFPYYFVPQTIRANNSVVNAKLRVGDGVSTVIDGGVLSNFPIEIFGKGPPNTIGVKLLPRLPTPEGDQSVFPTPRLPWRPLREAQKMIGTMIEGRDQARLDHLTTRCNVIVVETSAASILDFGFTPQQRADLIEHGREAAQEFIDTAGKADREEAVR